MLPKHIYTYLVIFFISYYIHIYKYLYCCTSVGHADLPLESESIYVCRSDGSVLSGISKNWSLFFIWAFCRINRLTFGLNKERDRYIYIYKLTALCGM